MSTTIVTEICTLHINEACKAGGGVSEKFTPAFELVSKQPGVLKQYWGTTVEDENLLYWFIVWDDIKSHHKFMASEEFGPLNAAAKPFLSAAPSVIHVALPEKHDAFQGPVIEVLTSTFKAGTEKETVTNAVGSLSSGLDSMADAKAYTWGWCVEKPEVAVLFVSWPSKEAHLKAVGANEKFGEQVAPLRALVESREMHHIPINAFQS